MKQVPLYVLVVVERKILHTAYCILYTAYCILYNYYVDDNNSFMNGAMLSLH